MKRIPSILFCTVAAWFIVVGVADISITKMEELPWIAGMVGEGDASRFDAPLDILANWIGMLLIIGGLTLAVLGANALSSSSNIIGAGLLSLGISGAQMVTLNAVGVPKVLLIGPLVAIVVSIVATVLSWRWRARDT